MEHLEIIVSVHGAGVFKGIENPLDMSRNVHRYHGAVLPLIHVAGQPKRPAYFGFIDGTERRETEWKKCP